MQKDIVYRIQDKDGRGPWKPGFSHNWVEDREDHDNLIAAHQQFGMNAINKILYGEHSGTGCLSIKQLRRWFTKSEYKKLLRYGYKAVKMEVNRTIASSNIQVLFGRAKLLKEDVEVIKLYD